MSISFNAWVVMLIVCKVILGQAYNWMTASLWWILPRVLPQQKSELWGLEERKSQIVKPASIWIHAASLGEAKVAVNLYLVLKKKEAKASFLFSFSRKEALDFWKSLELPEQGVLLPWENGKTIEQWIIASQVQRVIFCESDLWPLWIHLLHKHSIPIHAFSLRVRKGSLKALSLLVTQPVFSSVLSKEPEWPNYYEKYTPKISWVGESKLPFPLLYNSGSSSFSFVAAMSFHLDDLIKQSKPSWLKEYPFVIQVRHLRELLAIKAFLQAWNVPILLWPEYKVGAVSLVEELGVSSSIYQKQPLVFLGGSWGDAGVHNIFEPLLEGCFLCIGPKADGYWVEEALKQRVLVVQKTWEKLPLLVSEEERLTWFRSLEEQQGSWHLSWSQLLVD